MQCVTANLICKFNKYRPMFLAFNAMERTINWKEKDLLISKLNNILKYVCKLLKKAILLP